MTQRLEIVWRPDVPYEGDPLTDLASYFEISVKSCDGERYVEAAGMGEDGENVSFHVVPLALVRSVSTWPVEEPAAG